MLRLLLDTIPTRVFWKDRDSVYLGCNRLFALDAGCASPDEIVGKTDYDMPWKEQADIYQTDDRAVMSTGEPRLDEEPLTLADGRTVQLCVNKVPLKGENGNIIGVLGIYEDITDFKNAEEQLREREALYRTIFENSPFSVALINLSGQFVDINEKFARITGIPRDEAIGHTSVELGIMDRTTQIAVLDAIGRSGGSLDGFEIRARTRRGETKYTRVSTALVHLKGETLVLSILNDITERRSAEEALRKSEEKYRDLVQTANSIIFRWGRDGTVHFFNEFAQAFFGYTEEEILGRSVIGSIVPETETSGRDLQSMIEEIAAHPEYHGTNVNENMRKNGERVWIAWTNRPVFDENDEIREILSVGLDITPRIHDQQAMQESEARYRSIFNSNGGAFLLLETDGTIADANFRAAELYGYSIPELIGLPGRTLVDPGSQYLFEGAARMSVGEWFVRETLHIHRDGTRFNAEVHATKLRYGTNERLLEIIFDVTERNKIRNMMQLFTDVAYNMQVGLYICRLEDPNDDRTLRFTAANPAAVAIESGLTEERILGSYIDDVLPALRDYGIPQQLAEVVRTGVPLNISDLLYPEPGPVSRYFSFRAFRLPDDQVGVIVEDITDLIQAEEDKKLFYQETIKAATDGKLIIVETEDIDELVGPSIAEWDIRGLDQLTPTRLEAVSLAESKGLDKDRLKLLATCIGEATSNAVKHSGGGKASLHRLKDAVIFKIADRGPGIGAMAIPHVALERGYSTRGTLGMGYKMIIGAADRVYLATGPTGTTVAIELHLHNRGSNP